MYKKTFQKILKNEKKGYTLMYTLIAMVVCCALVFSTITISTYYNNNLARKTGTRGAIFSAQSGLETTEDYLNYCYKDLYYGARTPRELYTRVYDILNTLVVSNDVDGQNEKSMLVLQGYSNYDYGGAGAYGVAAQLSPDSTANISYKTYYSKVLMEDIKTRGEITLLSLGEYVYNNKAYYKFITVTVLIQPIYGDDGTITSFDFKKIKYNETLKGGTELWGSVQW